MPDEAASKACTVTEAMAAAKRGLELIRLTVMGEVSEFNDKPGYKAAYFTIRDDGAAMQCQMWKDAYNKSGVQLKSGMLVQVTGKFSCYPARGTMQFSVSRLEVAGEGSLRMQVAQLASKLQAEGLMDDARKRRSPALPERIAVITSPRGKAIRDVQRTLRRRYPLGELMVFGVQVEGEGSAGYMVEALQAAQAADPAPDVILLVRGGGSYESMMPFNDEALARAIAACTIPVVTGIGHEPDNSIADMVADKRCSTPTHAAESVAPSVDELGRKLVNATNLLNAAYTGTVQERRHMVERLSDRPLWQDPHYLTGVYEQTLDMQGELLAKALPQALAADAARLELMGQRLVRAIPDTLSAQRHELDLAQESLRQIAGQLTQRPERALGLAAAKLDALSPLKTLSRGYSITYAADGRSVITNTSAAEVGDEIRVRLQDGTLDCTVNAVQEQE